MEAFLKLHIRMLLLQKGNHVQLSICFCKSSFIGTQWYPFIYVLPMSAFRLQWQSWLAPTEWVTYKAEKICYLKVYGKKCTKLCSTVSISFSKAINFIICVSENTKRFLFFWHFLSFIRRVLIIPEKDKFQRASLKHFLTHLWQL